MTMNRSLHTILISNAVCMEGASPLHSEYRGNTEYFIHRKNVYVAARFEPMYRFGECSIKYKLVGLF